MSSLDRQPLTALVTGETSGLGKAIAVRLAREDLQVVVVGRDAARGAAVVAQIEAAGGQVRFLAAGLSDPTDIERLAGDVGDVDVLVNNADRSVWAPTEDMRIADFDSMFASNRGHLADEYIAAMRELFESDAPEFHGQHINYSDVLFAPVRVLTRVGGQVPEGDPETTLHGDADAIVHKIRDYGEAGVDRIVIEPVSSDVDDFLRQLARFADEITPHLTRTGA
jgi:hypothetical protein